MIQPEEGLMALILNPVCQRPLSQGGIHLHTFANLRPFFAHAQAFNTK